jgi:hypothetical protein
MRDIPGLWAFILMGLTMIAIGVAPYFLKAADSTLP